jgi:TolB-like protein
MRLTNERTRAMDESGKSGKLESLEGSAGAVERIGPERRVFISYATHDAAVAQKACSALETAGFPCWIAPRDVLPGTLYADGIVGAIDDSSVFVLILSKEAIASAHVGRELERATSKRHPIIALRIDTAALSRAFEYFLNQSQWIEVGAGGTDAAIAKLVDTVGRHLAAGVAAQASSAPPVKAAASRRTWGIAAAVVALALVASYFLALKPWLHQRATAPVAVGDKSIAVLPFVDMSEKKDQEYFADGMTEEIIDLLATIPELKVTGRTSSFQFKGHNEDLRAIGKQLGVAYILEGSIRKSGDKIRVTAQLIDSRNGNHLLSETYDRDLSDILKLQDEIAATLVRTLQVQMNGAISSRAAINNTEAFTLSLQGWHAFERYDPAGFEEGTQDFQRALELDPSFAAAAGGLAITNLVAGEFGFLPPAVAFERSRQAAELVMKLDPRSGGAHGVLASIHAIYDWDWSAADHEIKSAQTLVPYDTFNLKVAAQISLAEGKWDEALKQLNACRALDPLDPTCFFFLSWVQLSRGHLVEAEQAARRVLEISPTFTYAHLILGQVLLARHNPQAALAEMLVEADDTARLGGSAMAYFALGRRSESDAALAQMKMDHGNRAFSIAAVHGFRGDSDEAFKWLDRAYAQKDVNLYRIKSEVSFSTLIGDPRYKAFLKKMNLPE